MEKNSTGSRALPILTSYACWPGGLRLRTPASLEFAAPHSLFEKSETKTLSLKPKIVRMHDFKLKFWSNVAVC